MSFLKSLFGDKAKKLAKIHPAPNANEAQYQREALDSLNKGILPSGFAAEGYFCQKR
jgi:hypothetical protein